MFRLVRLAFAAGLALSLTGCPDEELVCVDVEPDCTPLYEPTWDNVYANTLATKCGVGGSSCHGGTSPYGGLHLDDPARAHANLTRAGGGIVIPGDASCSEMMMRVRAASSKFVMPRGSRLPASEACALQQWILAGAPGPSLAADAGVDTRSGSMGGGDPTGFAGGAGGEAPRGSDATVGAP